MKRLVLLCLTLTCWNIALAQQPGEWHPNIAEDNKTATWEQTSDWLIGVLNTTALTQQGGTIYLATDLSVKTSERCNLDMVGTVFVSDSSAPLQGIPTYRQLKGKLDLAKVDPLSIRVVHDINPLMNAYHVVLEGGDRQTVFRGQELKRNSWVKLQRLNELPQSCQPDKNGRYACEINSSFADYRYEIFVTDLDTGKRLGRALIHAALLCGGTKSVSPF
jgi:hypothetical protein